MITNLTPTSAIFLANVNRLEQSLADANSEVSSGKKVNVAPTIRQIQALLQLRTDEQQNTRFNPISTRQRRCRQRRQRTGLRHPAHGQRGKSGHSGRQCHHHCLVAARHRAGDRGHSGGNVSISQTRCKAGISSAATGEQPTISSI